MAKVAKATGGKTVIKAEEPPVQTLTDNSKELKLNPMTCPQGFAKIPCGKKVVLMNWTGEVIKTDAVVKIYGEGGIPVTSQEDMKLVFNSNKAFHKYFLPK